MFLSGMMTNEEKQESDACKARAKKAANCPNFVTKSFNAKRELEPLHVPRIEGSAIAKTLARNKNKMGKLGSGFS